MGTGHDSLAAGRQIMQILALQVLHRKYCNACLLEVACRAAAAAAIKSNWRRDDYFASADCELLRLKVAHHKGLPGMHFSGQSRTGVIPTLASRRASDLRFLNVAPGAPEPSGAFAAVRLF